MIPVIVLAGDRGGEGKSMLLKGLLAVFGDRHVFKGPVLGNFPLVDLPGKKVVFFRRMAFRQDDLALCYSMSLVRWQLSTGGQAAE